MATFPSIAPAFDAQKRSQPRVRTVQFGDGYEQRLKYGLNQNPKEWSLTFMVNDTDADTIETFLDARADDANSFDWTPPGENSSYKWVCREWTRRLLGDGFNQINATFSQIFEP
jgi:phage-related protein